MASRLHTMVQSELVTDLESRGDHNGKFCHSVSEFFDYLDYGSKTSGEVTESYQMQKHSIVCVLFVQD